MTAAPENLTALADDFELRARAFVEGSPGWDAWTSAASSLRKALDRESAPTYQPGDVAIATVRGVEGVLVVRVSELWMSNVSVPTGLGMFWHLDRDVSVTSRAVVVTEPDVERLLKELSEVTVWLGARRRIREWFDAKLGGGR